MQIRDGMNDEYMKWIAEMKKMNKDTVILCFDYLCEVSEKGMSPILAISNILNTETGNRPGSMSDDDIYLVMHAFSIFHKNGNEFRKSWNTVIVSTGYAKYIEEGNKKHLFPPFAYHGIFESDLFQDDDDDNNNRGKKK